MVIIRVSTINDNLRDFVNLFEHFNFVRNYLYLKEFTFDFSKCTFLRPNAVAFLGGLARLIEHNGGIVFFNWETMKVDVRSNLIKNGFALAFGYRRPFYDSYTATPYRQDNFLDKRDLIDYLKKRWIDNSCVNVSPPLQNHIISKVLEIYLNAFEHSASPIGVFTCGQRYPNAKFMKLSVIDFGKGIPGLLELLRITVISQMTRQLNGHFKRVLLLVQLAFQEVWG